MKFSSVLPGENFQLAVWKLRSFCVEEMEVGKKEG